LNQAREHRVRVHEIPVYAHPWRSKPEILFCRSIRPRSAYRCCKSEYEEAPPKRVRVSNDSPFGFHSNFVTSLGRPLQKAYGAAANATGQFIDSHQ